MLESVSCNYTNDDRVKSISSMLLLAVEPSTTTPSLLGVRKDLPFEDILGRVIRVNEGISSIDIVNHSATSVSCRVALEFNCYCKA